MNLPAGQVLLTDLPPDLAPLNSDRLQSRMKQFARLIGGDPENQGGGGKRRGAAGKRVCGGRIKCDVRVL